MSSAEKIYDRIRFKDAFMFIIPPIAFGFFVWYITTSFWLGCCLSIGIFLHDIVLFLMISDFNQRILLSGIKMIDEKLSPDRSPDSHSLSYKRDNYRVVTDKTI